MTLTKKRIEFLKKDAVQGFTEFVGYKVVKIDEGIFISQIPIDTRHRQQDGFVHAGVIATMADHTAGYASYTLVPDDHRILTVEYKINFLKPARGDVLECRAKVLKNGRKLIVAESEVFSRDGKNEEMVAKALLTMASVPEKKVNK